jgi:hypothetical protein
VRDQAEIMGFRLCHARFSPMLRVMSEPANTVPVTILTGFLGSGKTTVLNHLLRQPSLADTVVIVNEFGAVGLDHLLIEQAIEDTVLLKNGCICCTVRGDIADTLDVLWQRRDLPCRHYRGPGSSPIVYRNLLYLSFDGFDLQYVAALEKNTGKTVWRKDREINYPSTNGDLKKAYSTPAVVVVDGKPQLVSPSAEATIAFDPATGDEIWRLHHGGMNAASRPLSSAEFTSRFVKAMATVGPVARRSAHSRARPLVIIATAAFEVL